MKGQGPWLVLLPSGKGHIVLELHIVTWGWDFGGLCDSLATRGNGGKSLQVRGCTCPKKGNSLGGSIPVGPDGPSVDGGPLAHTWLWQATPRSARLG